MIGMNINPISNEVSNQYDATVVRELATPYPYSTSRDRIAFHLIRGTGACTWAPAGSRRASAERGDRNMRISTHKRGANTTVRTELVKRELLVEISAFAIVGG
ncbi:hypothetical protein [Streptomyces sp. NPDC007100]|uniref:hypothetical protein n=1 Tax=Streptomyces sp. NPDC007100 TaxID=3155602 RepID=UPI0033D14A11